MTIEIAIDGLEGTVAFVQERKKSTYETQGLIWTRLLENKLMGAIDKIESSEDKVQMQLLLAM